MTAKEGITQMALTKRETLEKELTIKRDLLNRAKASPLFSSLVPQYEREVAHLASRLHYLGPSIPTPLRGLSHPPTTTTLDTFVDMQREALRAYAGAIQPHSQYKFLVQVDSFQKQIEALQKHLGIQESVPEEVQDALIELKSFQVKGTF